jgi:hypothetical protein
MTLDPAKRENAAPNVCFQIRILATTYAWTIQFDREGNVVLCNACLESTLVHARLLIEFLAGRRRRDGQGRRWKSSDVKPSDFVKDWNPKTFHPLDGYLERIDKYAAHLSIERAELVTPQTWALERMVDSILSEFGSFVDAATRSDSPYADRFRNALERAPIDKDHPSYQWPPNRAEPV